MFYNIGLAVLCFIAGGISHFAMAPYNMFFTLFIGLPALFYCLQRAPLKKVKFLYSWLFAFGYFTFGLSWIGNALLVPGNEEWQWVYPLALTGLPALLSLFPALLITFFAARFDMEHISGWYAFVLAISLSEILRGYLFTGFPWNNFAYTWIGLMPIAQVASFGGLYFLTILTVFWASAPALIFLHKRGTQAIITFSIAVLTFSGSFLWGYNRLNTEPLFGVPEVMVHLIQPNVQQGEKWSQDMLQSHFENLNELTAQSIKNNDGKMNLIIWPETATTRSILFNGKNKEIIKNLLPNNSKNYLLTGILHWVKPEDELVLFNSLTIFGPGLQIVGNYDKSHLVPFGEYIPFSKWIPFKTITNFSNFHAGSGPQKINITKSFSISPLICYEIIFPGQSIPRERKNKPGLIVNVTNDAWYGNSAGPQQHLVQAQFRAIETGIPVARDANTGISALISPFGKKLITIPYGQKDFRSHPLILPLQNETYFAKYGLKITVALLLFFIMGLYFFRKQT